MTRDATTAFARALVDEWVRAGVRHAVIAPGSRSAPLAYALVADGRMNVQVVLDERAAAFIAVGIGRATGMPAVVLTTSGTAGANLHPAVLEAHHGAVPLIVCTADRPPEVIDTGAPQTIDQVELFGSAVRWFANVEVPTDRPDANDAWRTLGARSVIETRRRLPGPVHLNVAFAEPLVPTGAALVDTPGRPDGAPWTAPPDTVLPDQGVLESLVARIRAEPAGLLIAGWGSDLRPETASRFARVSGWPITADPLSGLGARPEAITGYEALARTDAFAAEHRPALALRVGGPITSTTMIRWLESIGTETVLIDPHTRWRHPIYAATSVISASPDALLDALANALEADDHEPDRAWRDAWMETWLDADTCVRAAIDAVMDGWSECSEPRIARDVVTAVAAPATLVVASSMPIRDVGWFARLRADVSVVANRGVNGIDGFVSTALGFALGSADPVVALTGDLSFLHDGGGRLAAASLGVDIVFVVIDNDGGGIFSFLPQADQPQHFERLFGTPPHVDLGAIAAAHGFVVETVRTPDALVDVVHRAQAAGGIRVVVVPTDRDRNVEHHRALWDAAAASLNAPRARVTPD